MYFKHLTKSTNLTYLKNKWTNKIVLESKSFLFGLYTQELATVLAEAGTEGGYVDLQKIQEAFFELQRTGATVSRERLTGRQIVELGRRIVEWGNQETLAQKYLNISQEKLKNVQYENRYIQNINRNIIRHWARKNPGPNQVTVPKTSFVDF